MGKSFTSCDSASHEGNTNTWFTPEYLLFALGLFDLDPCTQTFRPFDIAKHHICEDKGECGLKEKWTGRVWLNPPYGRNITKWLDKMRDHGNGIALVFARTETGWGQRILHEATAVNFIKGRLSFVKANGSASTNAGTGSMLAAYGENNVEAIRRIPGVVVDILRGSDRITPPHTKG